MGAPDTDSVTKREHCRGAALVLGPPGSGKTTLADAVAEHEDIATIEAGPLLKEKLQADGEMARRLKPYLDKGEMVPTSCVEAVLADRLGEITRAHVLFDGFPRTEEQVRRFFDLLRNHALHLRSVAILTLDVDEAIERLVARRVCSKCGAVFNMANDPPQRPGTCNRCEGELVRRDDDKPDVVRRRFAVYERQTGPVVAFFAREYPQFTFEHPGTAPTSQAAERIQDELTKS